MAESQIKEKYTKIPNDILERLMLLPLSSSKLRIILSVLRYTYRFNRDKAELSNSYLAQAIRITRSNLNRELKDLFNANILILVCKGRIDGTRSVISFNANFVEWVLSEKKAAIKNDSSAAVETDNKAVPIPKKLKNWYNIDKNKTERESCADALPSPSNFSLLNIDKINPDKTKKYGEYGWIVLSDMQYSKLVEDFGEDTAKHFISVVDEKVQSNGNKYGYKDWDLKIRQAIRDNWGGNDNSSTQNPVSMDKQSLYNEYDKPL